MPASPTDFAAAVGARATNVLGWALPEWSGCGPTPSRMRSNRERLTSANAAFAWGGPPAGVGSGRALGLRVGPLRTDRRARPPWVGDRAQAVAV